MKSWHFYSSLLLLLLLLLLLFFSLSFFAGMAYPQLAKVLYDYAGNNADELAIVCGEMLLIEKAAEPGWFWAKPIDRITVTHGGLVPGNYLQVGLDVDAVVSDRGEASREKVKDKDKDKDKDKEKEKEKDKEKEKEKDKEKDKEVRECKKEIFPPFFSSLILEISVKE